MYGGKGLDFKCYSQFVEFNCDKFIFLENNSVKNTNYTFENYLVHEVCFNLGAFKNEYSFFVLLLRLEYEMKFYRKLIFSLWSLCLMRELKINSNRILVSINNFKVVSFTIYSHSFSIVSIFSD